VFDGFINILSISIVTRLLAGSSAVRIPSELALYFKTLIQALVKWALAFFSAVKTIGGVRLTTALHLVRRLKMSGVIPQLPYMPETNLPLFFLTKWKVRSF